MNDTISRRSLLLILLDLIAITSAYTLALYIRVGPSEYALTRFPYLFLSFIAFPFFFYIFDLYHPYKYFQRAQSLIDIGLSITFGTIMLATASYLDRTFILPRPVFVYATVPLIPLIYAVRVLYDTMFRSHMLDKRALIIGTGPLAHKIAAVVHETPHPGIEIIGLVHDNSKGRHGKKDGIPVIGSISSVLSLIDWYNVQLVILALDPKEEITEAGVMSQLLERRVVVTSAIHLFERLTGDVPYELMGNHYLLGLMSQVRGRPYLKFKRIVDFFLATVLWLLLTPLFAMVYVIMKLSGEKKPFFVQSRIGLNGRPFDLIKLRTMTDVKKEKPMVTPLGKWLRKFRIDEIPQLINVIKGDMSMIGPRPEVPYFVQRSRKKIPFYDVVYAVKPGLTGWAQIKFRHATSVKDYNQKFRYNLYYLKNISLSLDLLIILKTIRVVVLGKGT